ncbi:MAG: AAA family ATPase, partial [Elusimicrobia bacterium]|nr:AAA family ATPase [Candidatus Obscuribacterium magneticum]
MLNYVSVKNFALLEDILLEFSGGLNALTGETGAGKTIVVDALGLVLGDKASAQQVRKGAVRLTVVAGFGDLSPRVKRLLRDLNLADDTASGDATPDGELLLRREVDSGGRSRCFVNDNPVNLSTVARLGELLVYVHGQHEHQLLLKPAEQMDLLDTLGHLESQRDAVLNAYTAWRDLVSQQQALSLSDQERAQRIDLYRFQKQELSDAKLKNEA